ncbi:bifunctional 2-keto-4-hydroxyglutarate aldolase/2-keto-3-deoxy-6-phosphogluconate aldolase, partial [Oceanivirga salmonicida]|uniref:bifunctional 2-keto-4-hydroxyglutarate aldolase/2-keto-3-deoxy-6-phosphogluconate aldolase n=1 Tax=Oceanivirga salmonicida TaxID=1769291 RepID=UPI00082B6C82
SEEAYIISEKIIEGGIKIIELTFTTPNADETIKLLSKKYENNEVIIGAGTVIDNITARIAILNGAKFIVSPNLDVEIALLCNRYSIPYIPGCGSVTEILNAMSYGCDLLKLFPSSVLGAGFIKDIKGPIPNANIMPSGGVSIDNIDEWLEKGAYAIGIGGALVKNVKEKGYDSIIIEANKFVEKYQKIKNNIY